MCSFIDAKKIKIYWILLQDFVYRTKTNMRVASSCLNVIEFDVKLVARLDDFCHYFDVSISVTILCWKIWEFLR